MGSIRLNHNAADSSTVISNYFIDRIMPDARGEYVKIYLYLLRCLQGREEEVSVSSMADLFNYNENDVLRALKYWERQGVLQLDADASGEIRQLAFLPLSDRDDSSYTAVSRETSAAASAVPGPSQAVSAVPAAAAVPAVSAVPAAAAVPAVSAVPAAAALMSADAPDAAEKSTAVPKGAPAARKKYSADDIQAFSRNPDIEELFFIIQTYLKHQLSSTDTNTILYWYDGLHFSTELIEYLVEYCLSKGHSSTRYMDKVAIGWAESGISTVEEAREAAAQHSQIYYTVMKALGIHGRNLIPAETDLITKWTKEFGFSAELIREACSRTIMAVHQPSFEYTDSILSSWHQNQAKTLEDVRKLDELYSQNRQKSNAQKDALSKARPNKFNNFNQRSYNEDQLEAILLNSPE